MQLTAISITEGDSTRGTASVRDQNGRVMTGIPVAWTSSAPAVASIDESGRIMALAAGQSTIAAVAGSVRGSAALSVLSRRVARVRITPLLDSLKVGGTLQLSAIAEDDKGVAITGRPTTWKTSDGSVAVVTSEGRLTASWAGGVTITVDVDGVQGSASLRVLPNPGVPFAIRGIKLFLPNWDGMYNEYLGGPLDRTRYESWHDVLQEIARTGANNLGLQLNTGVMVNPTDTAYSETISYAAPRAAIQAMAQEARSLGLSVTVATWSSVQNVTPALDRPYPSDRVAWLRNHRVRLVDQARFAQAIGASTFVVFEDDLQHLAADPSL
ncbi:MAG: Ig-like domain-containing protein, partial [bacterium]